MIIRCPQCETEYDVAPTVLPESGRKLKCTHCMHVWFENQPLDISMLKSQEAETAYTLGGATSKEPRYLDPSFDDFDADENIKLMQQIERKRADHDQLAADANPEASKARRGKGAASFKARRFSAPTGAAAQVSSKKKAKDSAQVSVKAGGQRKIIREWPFMLGLAAIATSLAVVFGAREPLARNYPDLVSLYAQMGYDINVQGIDILGVRTSQTKQNDLQALEVTGELVNVSGGLESVPPLKLSLYNKLGEEVYSWGIAADASKIGLGEVVPFRSKVTDPPGDAHEVRVTFIDSQEL